MAGTPILTTVRTNMAAMILTMTTTNGFNLDWSTVNQRNYAIGGFQRAEIYCTGEENVDVSNGIGSQDYTNIATFEIRAACKLAVSSANPLFDINDVFDQGLDDLKQLFGNSANNGNSVNGACDVIVYKSFKRTESSGSGDQFIPAKLITQWQVYYAQDRANPSQYASS
jgi:hypothetical protein